MLVGVIGIGLVSLRGWLGSLGLSDEWRDWRLLMVCGALPAILTFFIRLFVPESESWEKEKERGATNSWASRDLLTVLIGVAACGGLLVLIIALPELLWLHILATFVVVVLVAVCYLFPIFGYLSRAQEPIPVRNHIIKRMLLGALISGVPLLATWGAVQQASPWASKLGDQAIARSKVTTADGTVVEGEYTKANTANWKYYTQLSSAFGAVLGCIGGALLAGWLGRRIAYILLCLVSLGSVMLFFRGNTTFDWFFVFTVFLAGGTSAAFYGWLPLFLPELFPTRVRATGQGFSFNFGRILAAVGVLYLPNLIGNDADSIASGCSKMALIYVAGLAVIWLAPETKGQPLPE